MKFIKFKNKINTEFLKGVYKNLKINNFKKSYLNKLNLKDFKKYKQFIKKTFLKQNQKKLKKDKENKVLKNKKRAYFNELFNSAKEGGLILSFPRNINQLKSNGVFHSNMFPPSNWTLYSVPAQLMGIKI